VSLKPLQARLTIYIDDLRVSDPTFLSYLGTLGLRTHAGSGTDKPAFAALMAQAKARGW
jgi:hypothetical protein